MDKNKKPKSLKQAEKEAIVCAFNASKSLTQAAKILGSSRATIYRKLIEHNINYKEIYGK